MRVYLKGFLFSAATFMSSVAVANSATTTAELVNDWYGYEMQARDFYNVFARYLDAQGLPGAGYFYEQAKEEQTHADQVREVANLYRMNLTEASGFDGMDYTELQRRQTSHLLLIDQIHGFLELAATMEQDLRGHIEQIYFQVSDERPLRMTLKQLTEKFIAEQERETRTFTDMLGTFRMYMYNTAEEPETGWPAPEGRATLEQFLREQLSAHQAD